MKLLIMALLVFLSSSSFAKNKLALNWKAEPQFGGFYNWNNNDYDTEILEGGSGTPTVQMLASGQIEFAVVSADEIILAHDRGANDIVALMAVFQTNPQGIMIHADHPAKSLIELLKSENGTLLWQQGLPYALYLKKKLGADFKIKTAPYLGGLTSFLKDKSISQQCFVTSEPISAQKNKAAVRTFLVAESGYNPYTTVLATRLSYFKKNPDLVKKVVLSIQQGWEKYLQSPKLAHEKIHKINAAMTEETLKESFEAQKKLIQIPGLKLGTMKSERWKELAEQLHEIGLLKNKPQKPEEYFLNIL